MPLFFIAQSLGPAMTHGHVTSDSTVRAEVVQPDATWANYAVRYLVQHGAASTCPKLILCVNIVWVMLRTRPWVLLLKHVLESLSIAMVSSLTLFNTHHHATSECLDSRFERPMLIRLSCCEEIWTSTYTNPTLTKHHQCRAAS